MSYKRKYNLHNLKWPLHDRPKGVSGIKPNPDNWTEEALIKKDIHHAYLKHRAQAKFRKEDYSLTREQWEQLWTVDCWLLRGRGRNDLCLAMLDPSEGWHINNVEVMERMDYLLRNKEYRKLKNE